MLRAGSGVAGKGLVPAGVVAGSIREGGSIQSRPPGMETGQYQAALLLYGSTGWSHEEQ